MAGRSIEEPETDAAHLPPGRAARRPRRFASTERAMIPGPLVSPLPVGHLGASRTATSVRVLAVVMVMATVAGALAWTLLLSPVTLHRWNLIDSTLEYNIKTPGTYVIYEEGPGQATRVGPPAAIVSVRALSGRKVATQPLVDEIGKSSITYLTPWHEGRALLSFEVDHPGIYELFAFPSSDASTGSTTNPSGAQGQFIDLAKLPTVAVGPQGVPGALGTVPGLLLLTAAPLLVAVALFLFASWRWPSMLRRPRRRRGATDDLVAIDQRVQAGGG
jgi:hypothetical protein